MSASANVETNLADPTTASELQLSKALMDCNDCLNRGEFSRAVQFLDQALSLAPANLEVLNHRGRLHLFIQDHRSARTDFQAALRIDPNHAAANAGMARCQLALGSLAEAESYARRVLTLEPQNQEAGEVLTALKKSVPAKSTAPRKAIDDYFAKAREEFSGVEPPPLSEWHLKNSRILPKRESILTLLPKGGICAEIGTQTGDFARRIHAELKPAKLHLFDIDFTPFDRSGFESAITNGSVELHPGDSSSSLAAQPDRSFDFIYIDGDHAYEGVVKDLAVAAQKIKADGWIVCNDYTIYSPVEQKQYGVYRAVNEFCWQHGFEIVYLGLHYWSYHDVALRRMTPEAIAAAGPPPPRTIKPAGGRLKLTAQTNSHPSPIQQPFAAPRIHLTDGSSLSGTNGAGQLVSPKAKTMNDDQHRTAFNLDPGLELEIGEYSYIHDHTIRNPSGALTRITIGKFCCIATGLTMIGYDHHSEWATMYPFLDDGNRAKWEGTAGIPYPQAVEFGSNKSRGDVSIGNDVWIGCDVKLFKGVTIGDGAVIGACSLVNKSVEPYTIVAGIPARPIRKRFSDEEISLLQKIKWWDLPESLINRHMALLCSSNLKGLENALEADPEYVEFKRSGHSPATPRRHLPQAPSVRQNRPRTEIIETIGPGDEMFTGDRDHYFGVGRSALQGIETALSAVNQPQANIRKILDLPCGHGRVMRHLKAAFPGAQITGCDLNRAAVDFCARTFEAQPVYSNVNVSQIPLKGKFDLIWSGSLLTHLRAHACAEFIRLFNSLVEPGGLIVFTMHGRWVERSLATRRYVYGLKENDVVSILKEYHETGFGYADYPGVAGYGISVCSPAYVLSQLTSLPDLKLVSYHEKGWENHQDIVCLQKQPAGEPLG